MNIFINANRSLKNYVLTTATSFLLALSATATAFAQSSDQEQAIVKSPSVIQNVESFVSAAELLHNDVHFTPASLDINALKRSISYPAAARNVSGRFELIVYINSNGNVNSVNFVSDRSDDNAISAIIASACEAVKNSTFTPATLNHKAVNSAVRIPFTIAL